MAAAVIVNPHVTTDRSIDTRTEGTIVAGLIKPGMSDQDKAIAIYNYMRRVMFHYRFYTKYGGGGAINLINGAGYCLCTPTAGAQGELCEAAGLRGAILSTPGHGSVSVFYDGKWRWMDAFLGGCLWDKDRKSLASLQDVFDDPSLMKRDNPSPVDLFPCRDVLYADALRFEPDNDKYHAECAPDDFAWTARARPGETRPSYWKSTMTLDISLRPGERYVRRWDHVPGMYFLHNTREQFAPPRHFCGVEAEQRDTANWRYFKPYVKEISSYDPKTKQRVVAQTGRYWANGTLNWTPDLGDGETFTLAENAKTLAGGITQDDPARPAVLELRVRCPYMLVGGSAGFACPRAGSVIVSIAPDRNVGDKSPARQPEMPFSILPLRRDGDVASASLRDSFAAEMGTRGYRLRFEIKDGATLSALNIETIFQHNMYALPQLMPGKNEVKVVLANPEVLPAARFVVEFAWDEPGGKTVKERRTIDKSPHTFDISIPDGDDLPRMRHLILANEGPLQRRSQA
jgi:hypothetical protein